MDGRAGWALDRRRDLYGALFWSFILPAGSVGGSKIIADQDSGALYVNVGDVLYPALNLSSARLIAGQAQNPVRVRRSEIDSRPRGVMVGIPGAPNVMKRDFPIRFVVAGLRRGDQGVRRGRTEPVTVTVIDGSLTCRIVGGCSVSPMVCCCAWAATCG